MRVSLTNYDLASFLEANLSAHNIELTYDELLILSDLIIDYLHIVASSKPIH